MRAIAVDPQRRNVRLIQREEPQLDGPSSVVLRVLDVGVCGTDREIADFEYGTPPQGSDALVLGHEALAQVVEVGAEVDDLAPGDLVVPMVRRPCPHAHCTPCRHGRQDYCITGDYRERGIKELDGFLAELIVEQRQWLHAVPRDLRDIAVLVEPLTIAEKGLAQVWAVQKRLAWGSKPGTGQGLKAVVLGAGPVGLLGAMALRVAGFDTFMYSRSPAPTSASALSEKIGVPYFSSKEISPQELIERTGGMDLCYEAAGVSGAAFDLMPVLATNGVFVLTGVPGDEPPAQLDSDDLMRGIVLGNQAVLGTVNAGADDFTAAIDHLGEFSQRWPQAVRSLITGRFPMEEYEGLLADSTGIKNVIAVS